MTDLNDLFKAAAEEKRKLREQQENSPAAKALRAVKERLREENEISVMFKAKQVEVVQEAIPEFVPEPTPTAEPNNLVAAAVTVAQQTNHDSFQQPAPQPIDQNMAAMIKKMQFLEQAIGKIAITGPGGGAGDVVNLDHPTTLVSSSAYTVGRKDYYVGVNYAGAVTLTLPSVAKDGRYIIIKDESGQCSVNQITVQGTVDNDPTGFILAVNNGAIQMIYRNGWRIV